MLVPTAVERAIQRRKNSATPRAVAIFGCSGSIGISTLDVVRRHPERLRIETERLGEFIEVRPRIPFNALFGELQRAHLLLAVVGEHMVYSTPYKVYDYMAAGRPILGLAPRGAALFDLLAESGAGVCVDRDDLPGIERVIENFLAVDFAPARTRVDNFRWENLALQYCRVIETAAGVASPQENAPPAAPRALDL